MDTANIGAPSSLDRSTEQTTETEAGAAEVQAVKPFDWDAAKLRNAALDAIRTLAGLPAPAEVIAAVIKSNSYGEPVEALEKAAAWLVAFSALYREAEPLRWARVQQAAEQEERAHAAE
jgi:hypothetical protein